MAGCDSGATAIPCWGSGVVLFSLMLRITFSSSILSVMMRKLDVWSQSWTCVLPFIW